MGIGESKNCKKTGTDINLGLSSTYKETGSLFGDRGHQRKETIPSTIWQDNIKVWTALFLVDMVRTMEDHLQ